MRICLVSSGLDERNRRLQPWRYLFQTAEALTQDGHDVFLVSDGYPRLSKRGTVEGLPVIRLVSLRNWPWRENSGVLRAVADLLPDVVLWHLGLTSFLHLDTLKHISPPVIGIFTSPIYTPQELSRLGFLRLLRGWRLSAIHVLGLFVPGALIRRVLRRGLIERLVVECETTCTRLIQRGVPPDCVCVIRPAIDLAWFEMELLPAERAQVRAELGFSSETFVVGYFGPPTPLRGLPILLRAVEMVWKREPRVRLLILSRQRDGESCADQRAIERLMVRLRAARWTHMVTGLLSQERLVQIVAACDVVALPFEVVPSDVPLSVLEAMAVGVPVITTQVACLPELVPEGVGLCMPSADSLALTEAVRALAADIELRVGVASMSRKYAISWKARRKSSEIWDMLLKQQVEPR